MANFVKPNVDEAEEQARKDADQERQRLRERGEAAARRIADYIAPSVPATPVPASVLVVYVHPLTLVPAPWNPPGRTTRRSVAELIKRIRAVGFEPFRPLLISKDGIIGDGHRRWTAARYLELDAVPVIYTDQTATELWQGNAGARQITAHDWMAAHVYGGVDIIPKRTANMVRELKQIMGDEGVRYLADRGVSPDVYRTTWAIGKYVRDTKIAFLRQTCYWLVRQRMVHKVMRAIYGDKELRIKPALLKQAIQQDHGLRFAWEADE